MTPERDIDRVLDAWLAPGPSEMPDRVYLGVLDRIERVPQRRTSRLPVRFNVMPPTIRLAAAAVLLLAIGVSVGPLLLPPRQDILAEPSPSPTPATLEAAGLSYRWTRAPSPDALFDARVWVEFSGEDSMSIVDYREPLRLTQRVELREPGLLDLALFSGVGRCGDAEEATYAWQLSPRGAKLTLSAITDECPERAALVPGEYVRNACGDTDRPCAGPLDAGSYFSTEFAPQTAETTIVGGLRYTVPDGWVNDGESPADYSLMPEASNEYRLAHPGTWPAQVQVLARPYAAAQTDDCSNPHEEGVGHTIPDLVAWLQGHPGLTTGTPQDIVIGDLAGTSIDIDIDPAWTTTCTGYQGPVVALFRTSPSGWESTWEIGGFGTERDPTRVILLQLAEDLVTAVLVYPGATSTLDTFVAEAMPIIETFRFAP